MILTCQTDETMGVNHQLSGFLKEVNRLENQKHYHIVLLSSRGLSASSTQMTEAIGRGRFVGPC